MLGVYIHIPYCSKKCNYCNFYSLGKSEQVPNQYVNALLRDIRTAQQFAPLRPDTVYFGGGTPCLLTNIQVKQKLNEHSPIKRAQIT